MKSFYTLAFLLFASFCAAQTKQNVYFLKNNGKYVDTKDSADYIRIVSEPDSGSTLYNVLEVYKNGKRKFIGKSSKIERLAQEGQFISYFPNGKKKLTGNYKESHLTGITYAFFPNGKPYYSKEVLDENPLGGESIGFKDDFKIISCYDSTGKVLLINGEGYYTAYDEDFKYIQEEGPVKGEKPDSLWKGQDKEAHITFEEHYHDGILTSGISTDSAGNNYSYKNRMVAPKYAGGEAALYKYLGTTIRYPDYARRHNIQGTVVLKFVVKKDGAIKDIEVIKPADEYLDKEAVRVLTKSTGWQPGVYWGRPVNIFYVVPIAFKLQE